MKSKSFLTVLLLAIFSVGAMAQGERTNSLDVDIENSSVQWVGKKVTGAHNGSIDIKTGELHFDDEKIVGGSFAIDMTSITVEDIEKEAMNAKLVGHLKSDDFFNTEKFKSATMTIKTIEETSRENGTEKAKLIVKYDVVGTFVIKGISQDISFPVTVSYFGAAGLRADANITIDRTLFDIHYGADKSLGDRMIYKNFDLKVSLAASFQGR